MTSPTPTSIQRGQVWDVKFDPQVGSEIGKIRPAVVINIPSVGRLPLYIVVPITTGNPRFNKFVWMMPITADAQNGLDNDSYADGFQVKSVDEQRFVKQRGVLTQQQLDELAAIIAYCVGYKPPKPPISA